MDMDKYFTEEDQENLVDFLNMTATKAKFEMNTAELIKYFKLLSFMQNTLKRKVEGHILELKEVTKAPTPKQSGGRASRGSKK
jgi:hypothetical protein